MDSAVAWIFEENQGIENNKGKTTTFMNRIVPTRRNLPFDTACVTGFCVSLIVAPCCQIGMRVSSAGDSGCAEARERPPPGFGVIQNLVCNSLDRNILWAGCRGEHLGRVISFAPSFDAAEQGADAGDALPVQEQGDAGAGDFVGAIAVNEVNGPVRTPNMPARGGITVLRPGTNLARSTPRIPWRPNRSPVRRTQESGSSEMRQSRRSKLWPFRRRYLTR